MYLVTPKTPFAKDWINKNVEVEDWQWLEGSFTVDRRFIEDLELGMLEAGFTTEDVVVSHC